ncbi:MAG TPA: rubredoxin [Cytophagaceae bacterium]|jgi:rubredoxin
MAKELFKVNIRGGILSTGDIQKLADACERINCKVIHLGARQNIYIKTSKKHAPTLSKILEESNFDFEQNNISYPNIISSYAAEDLFSTHAWMSEGMYKDILNSFDYKPKLKINICDPTQGLVPIFTGVLNFIPSNYQNFYYVYINPSTESFFCWNKLLFAKDISTFSKSIENHILAEGTKDLLTFLNDIEGKLSLITKNVDEPLQLPRVRFPYYEGFNKSSDKFWLGIYRRKNDFPISLLRSISNVCNATNLGQINITPWKTFLLKGIEEKDRISWEKLLSRHGINSRHSSLELNWQLPDMEKQSQKIKDALVKKFDDKDIRTFGLTFAIKTKSFDTSSSIVIEKKGIFNFTGVLKHLTSYDIYYHANFSPQTGALKKFASNVGWNYLDDHLNELCKIYYKQLDSYTEVSLVESQQEQHIKTDTAIHHCKHCFTSYDPRYGDAVSDIPKGVPFEALDDTYTCTVCDAPKSDFILLDPLALTA